MPSSKSAVKPAKDRRRFSRHSVRGQARIEPLDEMLSNVHTLQVTIRDICTIGMLFEIEKELEVQSTWRVRFIDHNYCAGSVPFIVRNCRKISENVFQVGGMFVIEPYLLKYLGMTYQQVQRELLGGPEFLSSGSFASPEAA
jgi:hypothetical protein